MEEETRKLLLEHWYIVKKKIRDLESKVQENYLIKDQTLYLNPTLIEDSTPLNYEKGEFKYYVSIQNTLRILLREERGEYTFHFNGAPEGIKQLLDKS